jgi:phage shock protein C
MAGAAAAGRVQVMENITRIPSTDQPAAPVVQAPKSRFELRRSRSERMLSGVCGGVAKAFGIDATLVRLGLVALTVLGAGTGVVLYAAAWILIPEEDVDRSLAQDWTQIVTEKLEQNKN